MAPAESNISASMEGSSSIFTLIEIQQTFSTGQREKDANIGQIYCSSMLLNAALASFLNNSNRQEMVRYQARPPQMNLHIRNAEWKYFKIGLKCNYAAFFIRCAMCICDQWTS